MNYNLKIGALDLAVECTLNDNGTVSASVGEQNYEVRYRVISENQIHLDLGDSTVNVFLADDPMGRIVNIGGISFLVQDADALAQNNVRKKGRKDLPQEVTPPMPSAVVRVLVSEGDHVKKGQGVIVVSAMKMETTLVAPFAGHVTKINVAEGDKAMPGDVLVDIEKDEEGPAEDS
ncbi:MAG TPA: hypothetical protein PLU81_08355 [Deltaproteobacteria bacterium]|nr:hypothetical protein [Deltaproteobacteria bacterium]HPJ94308.1 hypothetical protein [Deltaproteobacteria bacterium]HPR51784.1 hypothetical protein [Deltaproteobacteria bacterium]